MVAGANYHFPLQSALGMESWSHVWVESALTIGQHVVTCVGGICLNHWTTLGQMCG